MKVVAFGKAVLGMVEALESLLGEHIVSGVASVPLGSLERCSKRGKVRYCYMPLAIIEPERFNMFLQSIHLIIACVL